MVSNNFSGSSVDPNQLLETFANGRIGELITAVVGNDELQRRFEQHPEFQQEEFDGKPSGIIALDLGIVTQDVKNALLVAQAAARTVAVVEGKIEPTSMSDDIFKFVGSERDPKALQKAQADWQISNGIEHDDVSRDVFKHAAASHIAVAAYTLTEEGFTNEAAKLQKMGDMVAESIGNNKLNKSPSDYAQELFIEQEMANVGRYGNEIYNRDENTPADVKWRDHLHNLSVISTQTVDSQSLAHKPNSFDK